MKKIVIAYRQLKTKYPDAILLQRNREFFYAYGSDAETVARLTGCKRIPEKNAQPAGVKFQQHELDSYLRKLVRAGYRVALAQDMQRPGKNCLGKV